MSDFYYLNNNPKFITYHDMLWSLYGKLFTMYKGLHIYKNKKKYYGIIILIDGLTCPKSQHDKSIKYTSLKKLYRKWDFKLSIRNKQQIMRNKKICN